MPDNDDIKVRESEPDKENSKSQPVGDNLHGGHRNRLKQAFLRDGLEGMYPHNALELLLFFAIPRVDTNDVAHELISKFGSLVGVFDASYEELKSVKGVGDNAAMLIKLIPQMYAKYAESAYSGKSFTDIKDIMIFFMTQFWGVNVEKLRLVCFDDRMKIRKNLIISSGGSSSVRIDVKAIVEAAIASGCSTCAIAHNHPLSDCRPSDEDISITRRLQRFLGELGITLVDHVVVGMDGAFGIISAKYAGLSEVKVVASTASGESR